MTQADCSWAGSPQDRGGAHGTGAVAAGRIWLLPEARGVGEGARRAKGTRQVDFGARKVGSSSESGQR
jgi:hypothetical protein